MHVCTGEREWIKTQIESVMRSVLSVTETESFLHGEITSQEQAEMFTLEGRLEEIKENQFLDCSISV